MDSLKIRKRLFSVVPALDGCRDVFDYSGFRGSPERRTKQPKKLKAFSVPSFVLVRSVTITGRRRFLLFGCRLRVYYGDILERSQPVGRPFYNRLSVGVFSLTRRLPAVICVGSETMKTTFIRRLFIAPEIGGMKWGITRICHRPETDIR
jgi:hypothetical protein